MAHSPISDPGYSSVTSSPVMPQDLEKFPNGLGLGLGLEKEQQQQSARVPLYHQGAEPRTLSAAADTWKSPELGSPSQAAGRGRLTDSTAFWLILYFFFNLSLTLYNKVALVSFPYPWTLTCIHSLCATIGSLIAYKMRYFDRVTNIQLRDNLILLGFSSLYTVNIAVSNLSLNLVSVPVHQVVRATIPLFALVLLVILYQKKYLPQTYLALALVVVGVCIATYGDYTCTPYGLMLTLVGSVLAAFKGIATNRILVGNLKFHPLDLLLKMSPLACIQCFILSVLTGEFSAVYEESIVKKSMGAAHWTSLLVNGALAFGLNVVSFTGNKKTSALTMSVCGNIKQVLTIVLAVLIFHLTISGLNLTGIAITIVGGAYYSFIEYTTKQSATPPSPRLAGSQSFTQWLLLKKSSEYQQLPTIMVNEARDIPLRKA